MSRLVVGVIGHVDHGKTALVRALTGQDTDRLPEEKARGISIALGFAHLDDGEGGGIDLIDMPGHERFVRTMISGATGIDAVLLVVAANEGVKPQTAEHVAIAGLLGIGQAVLAVSKVDLVSAEDAAFAAEQAAELLEQSGFLKPSLLQGRGLGEGQAHEVSDSPLSPTISPEGERELLGPILTSATNGNGIDTLRQALQGWAGRQTAPAPGGHAWLPIDRAFAIPGHGPVVTGTLRGASLQAGEPLELLPAGKPVRVRALQVHGDAVASAEPGQRTAVNLRGVDLGELHPGMALAAPGSLEASEWLTLSIRSLAGAPVLKNGMRLRALFGTSEAEVRLRLLDRDVLEPGDAALCQVRFARPVFVPAREHVILRRSSPAMTVAGGRVLEPVIRRLKRRDGAVLHRLEQLRDLPAAELIAAEVARAGAAGTTLRHLAQLTALAPGHVTELLGSLPVEVSRAGAVLPSGETARRKVLTPKPDPERVRADAERAAQIAEQLRGVGLTPPLPKEIVTDAAAHRAVEHLLREGALIRATDRDKGKELLFHRDAIADARTRLAPLLGEGQGLAVSEIAAALGISRKFCMPLLDHLDTIRFTRREGGKRVAGANIGG